MSTLDSNLSVPPCSCTHPTLGYIDGDNDVIYCSNCEYVLDKLTNVLISKHVNHFEHKEELDATDETGFVWCNQCQELL